MSDEQKLPTREELAKWTDRLSPISHEDVLRLCFAAEERDRLQAEVERYESAIEYARVQLGFTEVYPRLITITVMAQAIASLRTKLAESEAERERLVVDNGLLQAGLDPETVGKTSAMVAELSYRLAKIDALAHEYEKRPLDIYDRPESWGALGNLLDFILRPDGGEK